MNEDVAKDLTWSTKAFLNHVWPVASWACGGGRIEAVESVTATGFVRELDVFAGIDAWQMVDGRGYMRGIASRVQKDHAKKFRTFTVRYARHTGAETEFAKRLKAIDARDQGALYPALTVHAYVADKHEGPLTAVGVCQTIDLYTYIRDNKKTVATNHTFGEWFYCPSWKTLNDAGITVWTWDRDAPNIPTQRGKSA